jgi:DNA-directed RNA polymerase specialized sigma24 family protein
MRQEVDDTRERQLSGFEEFFEEVEPRLRRALVARFGPDTGREAAVDALVYGWRQWDRVGRMTNPVGYLYRVGVSNARPMAATLSLAEPAVWTEPWVEPHLAAGLRALSDLQRTAVILHHSLSWTYPEIAELLDVSVSTVRNHIGRGMAKLRLTLGVDADV